MKARRGGYSGGNAPFGYRIENGGYVIDPDEAEVVRFVFAKAKEGVNLSDTARLLNEDPRFRPRKSEKFYPRSVDTILKNRKTYLGFYHYGKDVDWVPGQHEPIISEDD